MDLNDLVVNQRYVPKSSIKGLKLPVYTLNNGILKKCLASPLLLRSVSKDNLWFKLGDLPSDLQLALEDVSISAENLMAQFRPKRTGSDNIIDNDKTRVYISSTTEILPIVGNILPNDGVPAFTVVMINGKPELKSILVCWGCHWSELFSGQTKYGENVFCLASDLTEEQRLRFQDDIIQIKDAPSFLGLDEPTKEI